MVAHLHEAPPHVGRKADERGELLLQEGECFVDGRQIGVGEVQRDDILGHGRFLFRRMTVGEPWFGTEGEAL